MALYGFTDHIIRDCGDRLPTNRDVPEDPDLHLLVGTGKYQKKVPTYAFALMECSPVFNAMLSGPWAEAREYAEVDGRYPIKINLPEDDAEGMVILCAIVTMEKYPVQGVHQMLDVTSRVNLSWKTLQQVAILAEKYLISWAVGVTHWIILARNHTQWELGTTTQQDSNMRRMARLINRYGSDLSVSAPNRQEGRYGLRPLRRKRYTG